MTPEREKYLKALPGYENSAYAELFDMIDALRKENEYFRKTYCNGEDSDIIKPWRHKVSVLIDGLKDIANSPILSCPTCYASNLVDKEKAKETIARYRGLK